MRYILGCDRRNGIIDLSEMLGWLSMELLIKARIFIVMYKMRKGLTDVRDKEIIEVLERRKGRNVELK